jgi:hypothetical protein
MRQPGEDEAAGGSQRTAMTTDLSAGRIALSRVLLGGLVAGVICNLSGMLLGALVLRDEARALLAAMAHPPSPLRMFSEHVALRLGLGVLTVWLYAALRPRFGPGPKTALRAALFVYLAAYLFTGLLFQELGIYSPRTTAIALAWGAVEVELMALAGAWLYRERGPRRGAR